MAVTAKLYDNFLLKLANKEINWNSDAIKVMLCTSTYVPNQATHAYKSDVTNEITGTGYTATGATLANKVNNCTSHVIKFDADDVSWASSTLVARIGVLYDSTPATDATRPLIGYIDFGADVSTSNGTFTIQFDPAGIATITIS